MVGAHRRLGGRPRRRGPQALPGADDQRAGRHLAQGRRRALGRPRAHDALRRPRLVGARHARGHGARGVVGGVGRGRRQAAGAADPGGRDRARRGARRQARRRRAALRPGAGARRRGAARAAGAQRLGRGRGVPAGDAVGSVGRRRLRAAARHVGRRPLAAAGPVGRPPPRRLPGHPRRRDRRAGRARAGGSARGGGRGRRGDPPLARHRGRAADRDRRPARRRAAAVPVGRRALRARRAARLPLRRAGPRQDRPGARRDGGRRRLPGDRHLPRVAEAQLAARDAQVAAASLGGDRRGRRRGPQDGRDHHHQLRGRRQALRDARAAARQGGHRRRVALLQEPARQAHAGRAAAVGIGRQGRAARRADRHAGAQPRRGADLPAADHRAAGRVRLRRALLAPVPGRADRGAAALAPAALAASSGG